MLKLYEIYILLYNLIQICIAISYNTIYIPQYTNCTKIHIFLYNFVQISIYFLNNTKYIYYYLNCLKTIYYYSFQICVGFLFWYCLLL